MAARSSALRSVGFGGSTSAATCRPRTGGTQKGPNGERRTETYHVGCTGTVGVTGVGGGGSGGARIVVGVAQVGLGAVPLVDHQVDGHFALQAADVAVAEVVAQFVYLKLEKKQTNKQTNKNNIIPKPASLDVSSFFVLLSFFFQSFPSTTTCKARCYLRSTKDAQSNKKTK